MDISPNNKKLNDAFGVFESKITGPVTLQLQTTDETMHYISITI